MVLSGISDERCDNLTAILVAWRFIQSSRNRNGRNHLMIQLQGVLPGQ
jgi:hypothetical protein